MAEVEEGSGSAVAATNAGGWPHEFTYVEGDYILEDELLDVDELLDEVRALRKCVFIGNSRLVSRSNWEPFKPLLDNLPHQTRPRQPRMC